ncbi:glycosyltransferase family 2 protein [Candidatus Roizmanbacteria bacterium]|nr:glycosyltransferase family 2 protein [Candidatus Roizmanbacteria bacterium]
MLQPLPSVTFVTCTYNSEQLIKGALDSIARQDYPKSKIKVLVIDGFSTDKTLLIVRRFPFTSVFRIKTDGPEIATALGYQKANSDYIVNFPSDNVILDKQWLKRMVAPLEKNKKIVASETFRYAYVRKDSMMNRYYSLFGVNDIVAYYLDKRDRATYFENSWCLKAPATDCGDYYLAKFNESTLPTVGANGFVIRKKYAHMIAKKPALFFHMDTCLDLVKQGYNSFAFVKTDIWHRTAEDVLSFMRKRKRYILILYFKKLKVRRYHIFDYKRDMLKLMIFIFFACTFIEPTYQAVRGFLKKPDHAWFLHPIVSFLTVINYAYTLLIYILYERRSEI